MKNLSTILKSGAFCLLLFSFAKIQAQDKAATMDSLMRVYAQYGQFNGSVLVAQKGKIVYEDAFGYANFEWDVPNTIDTRFRLASVSKQFTAMLIMQLVAEGKLALNEPISTYLPDYPKAQADKVRLHHLLTHSSGIPNFTSFPAYRKMMRQPISVEALVATFADSALEFTPGERFAYSNSGYALLGYIIEQVGGQSYEEAMQQRIFEPLGMKNSGYAHNQPIIKKRASGYNQNAGQFTNANHIEMTVPYAAGGLYSTVGDLHLWDQALYGEKLLPAKYRDMMFAEQIEVRGGHYGYGWDINKMGLGKTDQLLPIISHGGGINGFNTLIVRIPSDSSFVVLLNNTSGAPLFAITKGLHDILSGQPYDLPRQSLAQAMAKVLEDDGLESAEALFRDKLEAMDYYASENEINVLGYTLLQSGKLEEAAAIFKLNIEAYPSSFNVYDSYAEALMNLGDKEGAIQYYQKSIEMNPENNNGIMMLEKLGVQANTD